MSAHLTARRRQIARNGRPMTLRRGPSTAPVTVALTGFAREYRPEELQGAVQQGDWRVEILDDEIAAAGWPGPPGKPDKLTIGGAVFTVQGAMEVNVGGQRIGWSLWVRGG